MTPIDRFSTMHNSSLIRALESAYTDEYRKGWRIISVNRDTEGSREWIIRWVRNFEDTPSPSPSLKE